MNVAFAYLLFNRLHLLINHDFCLFDPSKQLLQGDAHLLDVQQRGEALGSQGLEYLEKLRGLLEV